MSIIHFLNVKQGDCTWIKQNSGRITMIDVNNAKKITIEEERVLKSEGAILGNFNQKNYPVNPVEYLYAFNVNNIFRFIITHPDMDHMGGIKDLFESFDVQNIWDTDNNKEIESFEDSIYSESDWEFYKNIRDGKYEKAKRLTLYDGARGKFYNENEEGESGGDGLYIISPTEELVKKANENGDYNDCSYVILYRTGNNNKILFPGDASNKTWEHILENHKSDVENIDVLIAPHHGRKSSDRNYDFLDVLNPQITYFGNASSQHLAYDAWRYRNLPIITNNQANCIVTEVTNESIDIYVTYEKFAREYNSDTYFNQELQAWFILKIY